MDTCVKSTNLLQVLFCFENCRLSYFTRISPERACLYRRGTKYAVLTPACFFFPLGSLPHAGPNPNSVVPDLTATRTFFYSMICLEGVLDDGGFRQEEVPGGDAVRGVREGGVRGGRASGTVHRSVHVGARARLLCVRTLVYRAQISTSLCFAFSNFWFIAAGSEVLSRFRLAFPQHLSPFLATGP